MKCAVGSCKENDSKKKCSHRQHITFYSFPRDAEQRKIWIKFCKRSNTINPKRERICALHFKKDDFERNLRFEMGFSNRSSAKLKPGAVPTLESTNTTTTDIKIGNCELVNTPMVSDIHNKQTQESRGLSELLVAASNREAIRAIKIVNEGVTFEEENIPMTIIKKLRDTVGELKASKVSVLETSDIKIENEEVTAPTIEVAAIKKEIETFSCEDSPSPELERTIMSSIERRTIKIKNERIKCEVENTSMGPGIISNNREWIGFNNRLAPVSQLGTVPIAETSAIKLGETLTCQNQNTSAITAIDHQHTEGQQPKTLEFIVFVPYRVQIRDPSI